MNDIDRAAARSRIRTATDIYAECMRTGDWPGYPDVTVVDMPVWYRIQNGV